MCLTYLTADTDALAVLAGWGDAIHATGDDRARRPHRARPRRAGRTAPSGPRSARHRAPATRGRGRPGPVGQQRAGWHGRSRAAPPALPVRRAVASARAEPHRPRDRGALLPGGGSAVPHPVPDPAHAVGGRPRARGDDAVDRRRAAETRSTGSRPFSAARWSSRASPPCSGCTGRPSSPSRRRRRSTSTCTSTRRVRWPTRRCSCRSSPSPGRSSPCRASARAGGCKRRCGAARTSSRRPTASSPTPITCCGS